MPPVRIILSCAAAVGERAGAPAHVKITAHSFRLIESIQCRTMRNMDEVAALYRIHKRNACPRAGQAVIAPRSNW